MCRTRHKLSNAQYMAKILLGELTLDDVPEGRRSFVGWMVRRFAPPEPIERPVDLLVHLIGELERARSANGDR